MFLLPEIHCRNLTLVYLSFLLSFLLGFQFPRTNQRCWGLTVSAGYSKSARSSHLTKAIAQACVCPSRTKIRLTLCWDLSSCVCWWPCTHPQASCPTCSLWSPGWVGTWRLGIKANWVMVLLLCCFLVSDPGDWVFCQHSWNIGRLTHQLLSR